MINVLTYLKNKASEYPLYWYLRKKRPIITYPSGNLPLNKELNFVLIVGSNFNQRKLNAETTIRMGLCAGFEKINIPYQIISIFDIHKFLDKIKNPICWLSGSDYNMLSNKNAKALRKYKHVVWVAPWFKNSKSFYKKNNLPYLSWSNYRCKKILSTKPNFVFTPGTKSMFRFFEEWENNGTKLVSIPLACDTLLYNRNTPTIPKFDNIKMAFVGGYWPEKARQFDKYLRPFEDKLTVFGYSKWPYKHYKGLLPDKTEPSLYKQALLSPAINEPKVEVIGGDICERVFKVLGSGGLTITDCVPEHYDIFEKNELIVPKDLENYKEKVEKILENPKEYNKYREAGHKAVTKRHTYAHRARTILKELRINYTKKKNETHYEM